jgi:hypothetical protein
MSPKIYLNELSVSCGNQKLKWNPRFAVLLIPSIVICILLKRIFATNMPEKVCGNLNSNCLIVLDKKS